MTATIQPMCVTDGESVRLQAAWMEEVQLPLNRDGHPGGSFVARVSARARAGRCGAVPGEKWRPCRCVRVDRVSGGTIVLTVVVLNTTNVYLILHVYLVD